LIVPSKISKILNGQETLSGITERNYEKNCIIKQYNSRLIDQEDIVFHIEENIINFDEKKVLMMKMIITVEIVLINSLK